MAIVADGMMPNCGKAGTPGTTEGAMEGAEICDDIAATGAGAPRENGEDAVIAEEDMTATGADAEKGAEEGAAEEDAEAATA